MQHIAFGSRQRDIAVTGSVSGVASAVVIDLCKRNILWNALRDPLRVVIGHVDHHIPLRVKRHLIVIDEHGIPWIECTVTFGLVVPAFEQEIPVGRLNLVHIDHAALIDSRHNHFVGHDIHQSEVQHLRGIFIGEAR